MDEARRESLTHRRTGVITANDKKEPRLNEEITAPAVRLIGADGQQLGIVSSREARQMAYDADLDLVEISPGSDPPVCRVMNYGKFRFEQNKKLQASKKKQKLIQIKEVKFRPGTDEGDYQVKLRNLIRFLNDGDKAKITVRFRGRELAHRDLGMDLLKRIETDLEEYASVEQFPKLEGRQMSMTLAPKKKKA
ncbi:translation initiation factor IF-3 [Methylococcus mesophilus]